MANTKSAIKASRQSRRRQDRNKLTKSNLKDLSKALAKHKASGNAPEATKAARALVAALDRATRSGVVHRNAAARHKSKLAKLTFAKA